MLSLRRKINRTLALTADTVCMTAQKGTTRPVHCNPMSTKYDALIPTLYYVLRHKKYNDWHAQFVEIYPVLL